MQKIKSILLALMIFVNFLLLFKSHRLQKHIDQQAKAINEMQRFKLETEIKPIEEFPTLLDTLIYSTYGAPDSGYIMVWKAGTDSLV